MVLDEQFIQKCREAFNTFDQDRGAARKATMIRMMIREFRDVAFEDVMFDNDSCVTPY